MTAVDQSFLTKMFNGLLLFNTLISNSAPLQSTSLLCPNKVKFLYDPVRVQILHSGLYFIIPDLSLDDQEILEAAILQVLPTATQGTVIKVPEHLGLLFLTKNIQSYKIFNQLEYRDGELRFYKHPQCLMVASTLPTDIFKPEFCYLREVQYVSLLVQGLVSTVRHTDSTDRVNKIKADIRVIRQYANTDYRPNVGTKGDLVLSVVNTDLVYDPSDPDFLAIVYTLLYNMYTPYTEIGDVMKWST